MHAIRQPILYLSDYFDIVKNGGIDTVVKIVSRKRKEFLGKRIQISPLYWYYTHWETWHELLSLPLQPCSYDTVQKFYYGLILWTLTQAHNMTFDTVPIPELPDNLKQICDVGANVMGTASPGDKDRYLISSLTFVYFTDVTL